VDGVILTLKHQLQTQFEDTLAVLVCQRASVVSIINTLPVHAFSALFRITLISLEM